WAPRASRCKPSDSSCGRGSWTTSSGTPRCSRIPRPRTLAGRIPQAMHGVAFCRCRAHGLCRVMRCSRSRRKLPESSWARPALGSHSV
ncbi:MAG: Acetyltransferase, GNAT family, partial [uncultured Lysobacter sp.]